MKLKRNTIIILALAAAALTLGGWLLARTPFQEQSPAVGDIVPELHLADISGRMIDLSEYEGKVVLINFWARWCPPCMEELGWFERVYQDYKDEGLMIVAISVGEISMQDAMQIEVSFPVAMANERVLQSYGDVSGVPQSFLIGPEGRIIAKTGRVWPEASLRTAIETALRGPRGHRPLS